MLDEPQPSEQRAGRLPYRARIVLPGSLNRVVDLPLPVSTLYGLWKKNRGPRRVRINGSVYVRGDDWLAWLDQLTQEETPHDPQSNDH